MVFKYFGIYDTYCEVNKQCALEREKEVDIFNNHRVLSDNVLAAQLLMSGSRCSFSIFKVAIL
jgi:hypothetical protein